MGLRLPLLLLVVLVILLVSDNSAAREEAKSQENPEGTDIGAGGKEKSKTQKDGLQPDTAKGHVKQKWQRYKTPSSKKMKKADSWKEKTVNKNVKEKWKTGIEEPSKQKKKRSVEYGKQMHHNSKGKWMRKDKTWKENSGRDKGSQVTGELNPVEKDFKRNKGKVSYSNKGKGKALRKDKGKSDMHSGVCLKDEPCSSDNKVNEVEGKNLWKGTQRDTGKSNSVLKSDQLTKPKASNPVKEVNDMSDVKEMEEHKESDVGTKNNDQNEIQGEEKTVIEESPETEAKEKAELKIGDNSNKKRSRLSVSELKENLSVEPEKQAKFSKLKGVKMLVMENTGNILEEEQKEVFDNNRGNNSGRQKVKRSYILEEEFEPEYTNSWDDMNNIAVKPRVRRYIVEEEIIDDSGVGEEAAVSDSEIPQLMQ